MLSFSVISLQVLIHLLSFPPPGYSLTYFVAFQGVKMKLQDYENQYLTKTDNIAGLSFNFLLLNLRTFLQQCVSQHLWRGVFPQEVEVKCKQSSSHY